MLNADRRHGAVTMTRRVLVCLLLLLSASTVRAESKQEVKPEQAKRYQALAGSIDPAAINSTITRFSSYPSRVVGYPGADAAADYVKQRFQAAGLERVREEGFKVTVPMVRQPGTLEVNGRTFQIHPLWPNLIRTSQL